MDKTRGSRRRFLKGGAALAVTAAAAPFASGQSHEHPAPVGSSASPATDPVLYGNPSRFVNLTRNVHPMVEMDMHGDPNGLHALTPLSQLSGIITPSALHYVAAHGNAPPDIDPSEHRLMIHGMVDRPLVFTLDELKRFPAVSRIHYLECTVNGPIPYARGGRTIDGMYGMLSCSEWTGVPLSVLLKEVGPKAGAHWISAEGVESTRHEASLPMGKAMDDVLVAYSQNGEPIRPHNGYPLRLLVPGFEAIYSVKWLAAIRVVDRPFMTIWLRSRYQKAGTREGAYLLEAGPKSTITFPSGGQRLPGPGFYTITGLAWSGSGAVSKVEVSTDGGRTWNDAQFQGPAHRIALTRFNFPWTWNGEETLLMSRCIDDKGQVQPSFADQAKFWGDSAPPNKNPIQPWKVASDGTVINAL